MIRMSRAHDLSGLCSTRSSRFEIVPFGSRGTWAGRGGDRSFGWRLSKASAKGLPCALYTERGGHYFHTPTAGGKVDKTRPTQIGRALAPLGIEPIAAYAPEAA